MADSTNDNDNDKKDMMETEEKPVNTSIHALKDVSEVEQLAERIESKRSDRILVTFAVRLRFLKACSEIASKNGLAVKISLEDLTSFRDATKEELAGQSGGVAATEYLGFRNETKVLLQVLEKGIDRVTNVLVDDWFYFKDFSYYFTQLESKWPWNRSPLVTSAVTIFIFYLFTPIFFCLIVSDDEVCPSVDGKPYSGWMTSLYFASATMSTVGYGDVSVQQNERWRVFMGILYMILAMIVLVTAFSAAAGQAFSPFDALHEKLFVMCGGGSSAENRGALLHQKLRRVKLIKVSLIVTQFTVLNLLGVFVARAFVNASDIEGEDWTWMTTLYWSVQTTTTIGYGDLDMPFEMRWFQIFYLVVSTYFVGDALGKIGSLQSELTEIRRYYAWERREVSKGMIEDMQAEGHDDQVDQFEFTVASLLELQKVSADDLRPIMEKFRKLVNPATGCISIENMPDATPEEIGDVGVLPDEAAAL